MQCLDDTQAGRTNISVLVGLLPDTQNYHSVKKYELLRWGEQLVGICIVDRIKFSYIIIWYPFDHEKQMFSVDSGMIHQNIHM